jgi:hypothetical protein
MKKTHKIVAIPIQKEIEVGDIIKNEKDIGNVLQWVKLS